MQNKQNVLITGSCGFVMGNLLRTFIYSMKSKYNVFSIDKGDNTNSLYWNKNHQFYLADLRDEKILSTIFELVKPDIVIHGADISTGSNNDIYLNNIISTSNLVELSKKFEVKNFSYISTDKIFDSISGRSENSPHAPNTPFGISKATSETIVATSGLNYKIFRLSNLYGPRQLNGFVPYAIKNILNNKEFYASDIPKDWLHVSDVSYYITEFLDSNEREHHIISNQELMELEVGQKLCQLLKADVSLMKLNKNDSYVGLKSKNICKWKPEVLFKDGIYEKCVYWYENNKWFLK